ncbi:hypothetical protein GCM10009642_63340 [Nocardiopsis metallicus]
MLTTPGRVVVGACVNRSVDYDYLPAQSRKATGHGVQRFNPLQRSPNPESDRVFSGPKLAPNAQALAAWARERIKQAPKATGPHAPAGELVIHSPARPRWRNDPVLVSP